MTENKRFELTYEEGKPNFWDNSVDLADCYLTCDDVVDVLNGLHEENQSIKKHIGELYEIVKIDVDNEIEVYPKVLLEYIVNILKIIGDVE